MKMKQFIDEMFIVLVLLVTMAVFTLSCDSVDTNDSASGDCQTDLTKARNLLIEGDFQGAFKEYECADTPEAAFGAGLTQLALITENNAADTILTAVGFKPFELCDVVSAGGLLGRIKDYWAGGGTATVSGKDINFSVDYDNMHTHITPNFRLEMEKTSSSIDLDSEPLVSLQSGDSIAFEYDCEAGDLKDNLLDEFYFNLNYHDDDSSVDCRIIKRFYDTADCVEDGGLLNLVEIGASPGEGIKIEFQSVLLECNNFGAEELVRFSGTFSGTISPNGIEIDDLHQLLSDPQSVLEQMPKSVTAASIMADALGLTKDLQSSVDFFDRADNGGIGPVFNLPSKLYDSNNGKDIPFTTGDAKIIAGAIQLTAAVIKMLASYDSPIRLFGFLANGEDNFIEAEAADEINDNVGALKNDHYFEAAQGNVRSGLTLIGKGLDMLEGDSLMPKTPKTQTAITQMKDMIDAALKSLDFGPTAMPHSSPSIMFDLQALFATPPDPSKVNADPVVVEEVCWGEDDCHDELNTVEVFWSQLIEKQLIDFDWDEADYTVFDEDSFEELGEQFFDNLEKYLNFNLGHDSCTITSNEEY